MDTEMESESFGELLMTKEEPVSEGVPRTEKFNLEELTGAGVGDVSDSGDTGLAKSDAGDEAGEPGDSTKPGEDEPTKEGEPEADELKESSKLDKTPTIKPTERDDSATKSHNEAIVEGPLGKCDALKALGTPDEKYQQDKKKTGDCSVTETSDESNLEVMMEKLHADKVESPLSKPKESSGMELSDVLQALTEEDPSDPKKGEKGKRSATKPCPKSRKKSVEASESESGNETAERRSTRSKVAVQSSGKKGVQPDRSGQSSSSTRRKIFDKSKEDLNSGSEDEKSDKKKGEVAPRGRGRPRKLQGKESISGEKGAKRSKVNQPMDDESSDDEPNEKPIQLKKPRGRPRKRPLDEEESKETNKSTSGGKGTKTQDEEQSGDSSDDEPTAKTPRAGRRRNNDGSGSDASPPPKGVRPSKKTKPNDTPKSADALVSRSNKVCVVLDCRQHCLPSIGISLHRFPMPNNPMRIHWLALINENPPGPNTAYICSKHFKEDDYTYDESKTPKETFYRKLKPLAFPSIGLPVGEKFIDEVRARVSELHSGKDPKDITRNYLKEIKKKIKVEDEPGRKTSGSSSEAAEASRRADGSGKAASRSPSPKLVETPSRTPAAPKKRMEYESKGRTPGTNCSVPCCGNNLFETRAEGLNVSYYRFPFDDALAARWIKKIGDPDLVARTARICSDHFLDKDFEGTLGGKRNLKPKAVPTQYLSERKPRNRSDDYDRDSADEESEDEVPRTYMKKKVPAVKSEPKKSKKSKPDTSAIPMPLPIIEEVDIKSEPASDNEVVGQEYVPEDPGSDNEESEATADANKDKASAEDAEDAKKDDLEDEEPIESKKVPPKKDLPVTPPRKIVMPGFMTLPLINVERLGQRVIDAAESGSLRVRIKESAEGKARAQQPKPTPKLKRKLPESDNDLPSKVMTRPGPLCKKKNLIVKTPVAVKKARSQKILKMSDYETSDSDVDDPMPPEAVRNVASTSFTKSPNPVKVKLAELPSFLRERVGKGSSIPEEATMDITSEELDAIINSDKSEKDKIIKLVEQRISEHTKIIEGKSMGAQELADHNKILQGSALVLKKLAEKSGKPLTPSQVISLNVPDNTSVTPGRTIVLKKVPDPGRLGLKPPRTVSSPTSPNKPPTAIVTPQSSPARALRSAFEDISEESKHSASPIEKIRDYDNLMKKYLSAVLDKNVMSKKYTESKENQKLLESKLSEKMKECENLKRKAASLNAKMNRVNTALEYFLTPNQIKLALQETKKVAWSPEEMLTAFTIKHLSKACYLFLRHKLNYPLPGISSLQRWMTMLSKDKTGDDDDDNIADEDLSDKEEGQEILVEGSDVVNEISGTLEEINAGGVPGEDDEFVAEEHIQQAKDSDQSSPFQVVFENEHDSSNSSGNQKVIILKKMTTPSGKLPMKSKLHISASRNVSSMEGRDDKNELYKLLPPGTKTISMASSLTSPQKRKVLVTKKIQEKEKITFQRLPQVRKEIQKPPTIQVVKNEPQEDLRQFTSEEGGADESLLMDVTELGDNETIVKPEDVSHQPSEGQQQLVQQGGSEQKYFTISDLNSTQMEEHVVENVEHSTEEGQMVHAGEPGEEQMVTGNDSGESGQAVHDGASGLEELVQLATSGEQQIAFATTDDLAQAGQFAQIAYTQGSQGEITLSEDINNMTAVVINDIDEDQLNSLLMSNVVEGKSEQSVAQFGQKKIVYQTIDNQKNVIVLQPDSQAFIEEDEGANPGAPRVYIINDNGHIVSPGDSKHFGPSRHSHHRKMTFVSPSSRPQANDEGSPGSSQPHEISFIDSASFAELGLKLNNQENLSLRNLIQNYAIDSPEK